MKSVKKGLLVASAVASVCGSFCLVACGGSDPVKPPAGALSVPGNVHVVADTATLEWSAVTGATSGYTVKINSDETTKVNTTSLDLTTVVTLLVDGDNTLQVKANAAGDKKESAYSTAVTYEYHAIVTPPEKTPFDKVTITLDAEASTVSWAAVTGATNGYTVKVNTKTTDVTTNTVNLLTDTAVNNLLIANADNTISVMVKAAGDHTDSAYSDPVTYKYVVSADKAAKDFIAAVNAIGTVNIDKADLIDLAKTKYAAIKDDEEALEVEGVSDAIATLKQKDAQYFSLLVAEVSKAEVTEDSEVSAFTAFTAKYDAASAYYDGLLDNTVAAVIGAKGGLDAAKDKYDLLVKEITDGVDELAEAVDALSDETTITLEYYEQLTALKEQIDGLCPYAVSLWDAADTAKVESEITRAETTPVGEPIVSANTSVNGDSRKLFIAVTFKNFRGEVIAVGSALPQISVEFEKADPNSGSNVTVLQQLTKNTSDNNYVAIISMYGVGGLTSASYTIGDGAAIDIDVTPTLGSNPYFSTIGSQFKDAFNGEIILLEKAGFLEAYTDGKVYLEMYEEGSIEADSEGYVRFVGQPIGERIDVTAWTAAKEQKIAEFERYLALNYSDYFVDKTRSVHFVIYGEATLDGNTTPSRTAVQLDTVSNPREFKLTEYDKYYHFSNGILESGIDSNGDVLSLFTPGRIPGLVTEINDKLGEGTITGELTDAGIVGNITTYVRVKVETLVDGKVIFTTYAPLTFRGYTLAQLVVDCSEIYYKNQGNTDDRSYENVSVRLSFDWTDEATAEMKNTFQGGATTTVDLTGDQTVLTLDKTAYTVPSTVMNINGGGDAFEFFRNEKDGANTVAGYVMNSGNVKYAKLDFYRTNDASKTVKFTAYIHNVDGNAKLSLSEVFNSEDTVLGMDIITNSWVYVDQFKEWFTLTAKIQVDGYALRWDDGWSVSAQYVRSDDSEYLFDGTPNIVKISDAVEATEIPNAPQMGFDGVGNATFVRAFGSYQKGEIFTSGAAKEVEIHFYQGDTETTDYKLSLRYDSVTGECKLYDGDTAVSAALAGGVGDLWCDGTTLDGAIRAYLTARAVEGADSATYTDGWKFYTVIIAREGNLIWTGEKGAQSDTVSYPAA